MINTIYDTVTEMIFEEARFKFKSHKLGSPVDYYHCFLCGVSIKENKNGLGYCKTCSDEFPIATTKKTRRIR